MMTKNYTRFLKARRTAERAIGKHLVELCEAGSADAIRSLHIGSDLERSALVALSGAARARIANAQDFLRKNAIG